MRAVLTTAHGDRSVLKCVADFSEPRPAAGEVVIDIAATAVNFHDIFTRRGMPGITIKFPLIVGSDMAGVIKEVGANVGNWRAGDRVLVDPIMRNGRFGMLGETSDGGRAEQISLGEEHLIAVPKSVSLESAAALPLAYGTAHRMMITRGQIKSGETVLVLGASGGVGVACVQLAKMVGAKVIACASSAEKLNKLQGLGADYVVDYTQAPFKSAVHEIVGKPRVDGAGGVDVAVNFTGGDTWEDTQRCVKLGGRILTCGATAGFSVSTDMRYLWSFEHDIRGSDGWARDDLIALLDYVAAGKFSPVIDAVLPLEEAAEAERMLEDREVVGKVLLKP
jgi:alcohol dehydrogenase